MTPTIHVRTEATTYTVSALPEDNINHGHFQVTVEKRGPDSWAVMHGGYCLGTDGDWEYEMSPSSRTDDWLATHRFDLDTALRIAEAALPDVTVNGMTAADVLARIPQQSR